MIAFSFLEREESPDTPNLIVSWRMVAGNTRL
jgi:hypothetical protein